MNHCEVSGTVGNSIDFIVRTLTALFCACVIALNNCAAAAQNSVATTEKQAVAIIWQLSEVIAWKKFIEKRSEGKVRAALIVRPQTPVTIGKSKYWSVAFYENQPTHFHRWQTFFVRIDGKEVLVDDIFTGDYFALQKWREKAKPLDMSRAPDAPVPANAIPSRYSNDDPEPAITVTEYVEQLFLESNGHIAVALGKYAQIYYLHLADSSFEESARILRDARSSKRRVDVTFRAYSGRIIAVSWAD